MKVYFMKKDALEILKSNLELTYTKYYTESDNKWLWDVCGGNPFGEFKEIPDFELAKLDSDLTIGEVEFNNCKFLYKNLSFLSDSQASDERLWAGLCHSVYYPYLRKRWGYDKQQPKKPKEAISNIKSRFFFSGGTRAGLYRNTMAKCWWVGRNTFDKTKANPFEKLDILGSNDISSKISDIFYSNTFSSNALILNGIVQGIKYFNDAGTQLTTKEHIRPTLQLLNAVGGGIILDCLSSDDIADIFMENIHGIIQGDTQGMDFDELSSSEYINDDSVDLAVSDEQNRMDEDDILYVSLGQKVVVRTDSTGDEKTYKIDYLKQTGDIPGLVKELLGKSIGDKITYAGNSYTIIEFLSKSAEI
ncbi:MAG: DUF6339 family protein [Eubacteriales bacterium]|nr:DUF6339 family protein [Eubacteriales bacterium]